MKNSYMLYGDFWDGKPIPEKKPELKKNINVNNSVISLVELLKNNHPEKIEDDFEIVTGIIIDYVPSCVNKTIIEFFLVRLLQMATYYNAQLYCENDEQIIFLSQWILNYYNKKNTA